MDRTNLPFRRNCEGYLICKDGQIISRDTGKGYLEFPGGGVDENETPEQALAREAYEEAGVILFGNFKKIKVINFIWGKDWAKTEKQKERYNQYKGEEMHFFIGRVKEVDSNTAEWKGRISMRINEAIEAIEKTEGLKEEAILEGEDIRFLYKKSQIIYFIHPNPCPTRSSTVNDKGFFSFAGTLMS